MAGVQWARQILDDDARRSEIDHLGEPWALALPPIPMEDGEIRGAIVDAQGRLNVNALGLAGAVVAGARASRRFSRSGGAPPARWPTIVADWIDEDGAVRESRCRRRVLPRAAVPRLAAERATAARRGARRRQGHDAAGLAALLPFLSALPTGTPVNVNTAPPEVLAAIVDNLDGRAPRRIASPSRARKPFTTRCRIPRAIAGWRDARERCRAGRREQLFLCDHRRAPRARRMRAHARSCAAAARTPRSSGRWSSERPHAVRRVNYGDARAHHALLMTVLRVLARRRARAGPCRSLGAVRCRRRLRAQGPGPPGRLAGRGPDRSGARRRPQVRIATSCCRRCRASRVAGAAAFALEDQLAGPSTRASRRGLGAGVATAACASRSSRVARCGNRRRLSRMWHASSPSRDLAVPTTDWRWCAREPDAAGFVRRPDGSAFPVDAPSRRRARFHRARDGARPGAAWRRRLLRVFASMRRFAESLARWHRETGIEFVARHALAMGSGVPRGVCRGHRPSAKVRRSRRRGAVKLKPGRLFAPALAAGRRGACAARDRDLRRMGLAARSKPGAMPGNGRRSPPAAASRRTPPPTPPRLASRSRGVTRNCATRTACPRRTTRCRFSRAPHPRWPRCRRDR